MRTWMSTSKNGAISVLLKPASFIMVAESVVDASVVDATKHGNDFSAEVAWIVLG